MMTQCHASPHSVAIHNLSAASNRTRKPAHDDVQHPIPRLPGDALVMQERITKVLELNNQFYPGKPLSFAIGQGTCQAGESLDQTIQQADRAMYEAKAAHYKAQTKDRRAR